MIYIELTGMGTASGCGRSVRPKGSSSSICKLARQLIGDGYAAHDLVHISRGGTLCFNLAPLSHWAKNDVSEGDAYGVRMVKHRPFDADVWG